MILLLIFNVLLYVLTAFTGLLPIGSLPSDVGSAITSVFGYLTVIQNFFPMDTLMQVFLLSIAVDLALSAWWFGNWVFKKVTGH